MNFLLYICLQDEDLMNDPFADEENMFVNPKELPDPPCNLLEMTGKCEPKRDVDDRLNPDTWSQSRRYTLLCLLIIMKSFLFLFISIQLS